MVRSLLAAIVLAIVIAPAPWVREDLPLRPRPAAEATARGPVEDIQLDRLQAHVATLASPAFEGRRGIGALKAAAYIRDHLRELRLRPLFAGSYFQGIPAPGITTDPLTGPFVGYNVGAVLPGSDPGLKSQYILIGAHLDHLGIHHGQLYPGADDNATGVAMLLETARHLVGHRPRLRRSVIFLAFGLEEQGLWGSRYYAAHPAVPLNQVRMCLIADMLGRSLANVAHEFVFVMGSERCPGVRPTLAAALDPTSGLRIALLGVDIVGTRSDYGPFRDRGVPFLFFSTGQHPDYHQPTDLPDRIEYPKLYHAVKLIDRIACRLADLDDVPSWADPPVQVPMAEAIAIRDLLGLMLDRGAADRLSPTQRFLVESSYHSLERMIARGSISLAERAWMVRLGQMILVMVL